MRAETTAEATVGREGRSGAVSAAAGAAGDSAERIVLKKKDPNWIFELWTFFNFSYETEKREN